MIYLLWSLLNLAALIWFLFICFSNLKEIREGLGLASAIVFVVCCLSFIKESLSNNSQVFPADPEIAGQEVKTHTIQNDLFFHLDLLYSVSKDSPKAEMTGITVMNGLVIGHNWKPALTKVYAKGKVMHYFVAGTHEWKLLGLTLYNDPEEFKGTVK